AVKFRLRGEEALERGAGQLARIPRVVGAHLGVADASADFGGEKGERQYGGEAGGRAGDRLPRGPRGGPGGAGVGVRPKHGPEWSDKRAREKAIRLSPRTRGGAIRHVSASNRRNCPRRMDIRVCRGGKTDRNARSTLGVSAIRGETYLARIRASGALSVRFQ